MTTENPIRQLLQVLSCTLADASQYADEASMAMAHGEQNQAIGALLYLDDILPTAQALYRAALTLHRLPRKGGAQ